MTLALYAIAVIAMLTLGGFLFARAAHLAEQAWLAPRWGERREKRRVMRGSLAGSCALIGAALGAIGTSTGADAYVVAALVFAACAATLLLSSMGPRDAA